MSVSCEISNVLSNYANTIYMMDQAPYEADLLPLPNMDLPFEMTADRSSWSNEFPFWWTKQHVLEWISYHVEKNKWDASAIDFSCCNMDGAWLCRLSCEDLLAMFGPLGEKLHNHLCELNSYFIPDLNELLSDLPFYDDQPVNQQHDSSQCSSSDGELQDNKPSMTELTFPFENRFQPGSPSSEDCSSSNAPNSPGSTGFGGSESDLERAYSKSNLLMDVLEDFESDLKQQKRKRGRPRKISKDNRDCLESKKNKHSSRGSHLWEFIRDILIHPELNEGLMKWEDRSQGIFKFLRSEAVAQLWGQKKKNTSMTYEKLSRAMRYYYKREILERVDGRRLVYKFGKNSSGWKEEEALSNQS